MKAHQNYCTGKIKEASRRLILSLAKAEAVTTKDDREELKAHIKKKFG